MNQEIEIDHLAKKALLIISFLEDASDNSGDMYSNIRGIIQKALDDNNLKGMEIACKNLFEWSSYMTKEQREKLNEALLKISGEQ